MISAALIFGWLLVLMQSQLSKFSIIQDPDFCTKVQDLFKMKVDILTFTQAAFP